MGIEATLNSINPKARLLVELAAGTIAPQNMQWVDWYYCNRREKGRRWDEFFIDRHPPLPSKNAERRVFVDCLEEILIESPGIDERRCPNFTRAATQSARHFATHLHEDGRTLEVWYTARNDKPERIFRTTMDLAQVDRADELVDSNHWSTQVYNTKDVHQLMLNPEVPWEGSELPIKGGANGQTGFSHAMRATFHLRK